MVKIREESGLDIEMEHLENPRMEQEEYYYKTDGSNVRKLGFLSTDDTESEPRSITQDLVEYESGIEANILALISDIRGEGAIRMMETLMIQPCIAVVNRIRNA